MGKKYTVISNSKFLIQTQWQLDKNSVFFAIASPPMEALVSLISVYLLKLVVDSIENGYSIYNKELSMNLDSMSSMITIYSELPCT